MIVPQKAFEVSMFILRNVATDEVLLKTPYYALFYRAVRYLIGSENGKDLRFQVETKGSISFSFEPILFNCDDDMVGEDGYFLTVRCHAYFGMDKDQNTTYLTLKRNAMEFPEGVVSP